MCELARQLVVDEARHDMYKSTYSDNKSLVEDMMRRRYNEQGAAPLLVLLSDLDGFAMDDTRQTLLYFLVNLFHEKEGGIVIVGVTTDHNVLELFEKRVRSRLCNHLITFSRSLESDVLAMKLRPPPPPPQAAPKNPYLFLGHAGQLAAAAR